MHTGKSKNMLEVNLVTTLKGHQNQVFALEKGNANTLFSAGNDKGVVEWDLESLSFRRILCAVSNPVYALHRIPDTTFLAVGLRSGEILIVDYSQKKLQAKFSVEKGAVFALKTLKGKSELIAIGEEGVAYVYDIVLFRQLYRFRVSNTTVRTIAVAEDEDYVYFADKDGVVFQYDSADYHLANRSPVHSMPITSMLYSKDKLFTGGRDAKLYTLNATDLSILQELTPHMFTVYGIVPHPSLQLIATVSRDKTWKIWDSSLKLVKNVSIDRGYDSHHLSINTVLWDEKYLYTAGDDKAIKVWQVELT